MNARNRNLLAIALATALLSPGAWAEKGNSVGQAVRDTATRNVPEQTAHDVTQTTTAQMEQTTTTPPPSPPQSQGSEHAASHSSVVQRDLWTRLDTNNDGKISTAESAVDTEFDADFATMDVDKDGFVTDSEYRMAAKDDMETGAATGGVNASSQSNVGMRDAMSRLDANADGSISASESEADATIKSNFATIDANSDGTVSSAEYRAWVKAERK
jgi:Ca2+-binding EF-hand superfamily protein